MIRGWTDKGWTKLGLKWGKAELKKAEPKRAELIGAELNEGWTERSPYRDLKSIKIIKTLNAGFKILLISYK